MDMGNIDIRDAFFDRIFDIATKDKNVIFISADTDAFSLRRFRKEMPEQYINIGVAEQNMITVAAGLGMSGKKVFIYAIIPFITMRCYEHIKNNICSMNVPVTIIGLGPGLSFGFDGPTHHGMQDIGVMRTLPEITIFNPCDGLSADACAVNAYKSKVPVYVRIDKGKFLTLYDEKDNFLNGLKVIKKISDINIVSTGFMSHRAIEVADELSKHSLDVGVIDLYRIKPISKNLLKLIYQSKQLVTIEENSIVGGIGTVISELITDNGISTPLKRIALEDKQYFDYGSREWLHHNYRIDTNSIVKQLLAWCY